MFILCFSVDERTGANLSSEEFLLAANCALAFCFFFPPSGALCVEVDGLMVKGRLRSAYMAKISLHPRMFLLPRGKNTQKLPQSHHISVQSHL